MWVILPVPSSSSSIGKQSQLLVQPTEVELGLQVGVEFDNKGYSKMQGTKIQDT